MAKGHEVNQGDGHDHKGLHEDTQHARGGDLFFYGTVKGEARADDDGKDGHLAVGDNGDGNAEYGQGEGHPLQGPEPFVVNEKAQHDGEDGIHVIGQGGVDDAAGHDGDNVAAPVNGNGDARQEQKEHLPLVFHKGEDGEALSQNKHDDQTKEHGKDDSKGQDGQGIHGAEEGPIQNEEGPH